MATEAQLEAGAELGGEYATVNRSLTQVEFPKFQGLQLKRDIILGDFEFNTIDSYGVVWIVTDLEGWWNPPSPEFQDIPRGFGDGSYDLQGRYEARTMSLNGVILTTDRSLVEAARDRLVEATDLVYRGVWLRTGSNPIRSSFVRLNGQISIQTVNARGRTEFQIPLKAADPIKYAWNDSQPDGYLIEELAAKDLSNPSSGSITLVNEGNYKVPVILEISGPVVGPATVYNRTTDQLLIVTEGFGGSLSGAVENKQLSFDQTTLSDVATLTTRKAHEFPVGAEITVSGVGDPFDGTFIVESIPTSTTFTYVRLPEVSAVKQVSYKSLLSSVAKLETTTVHGFSVGDTIVVKNVDSVLDGTHTIASIPTSTSLTFPKTRIPASSVTGKKLISNIATLTTSSPHGFLVGENVTVTGVEVSNYDGTYVVSGVSTDGLQFSYAKSRTDSKQIVSTFINNLIASVETSELHGFVVGESVTISELTQAYNGTYSITSVSPGRDAFSFERVRTSRVSVIAKSSTAGVGTLTTSGSHRLLPGDQVEISNVDSVFNGTRVVTSIPSSTAFSFALATDVTPTQVIGGYATPSRRTINSKSLIGGVATLGTLNTSGILVGESVVVSGVDAIFNGTYVVTNASDTSFSYTKSSSNVSQTSTLIKIFSRARSGSTVTVVTRSPHGFTTGLPLTIQNLDLPDLNGYFTVASVPNTTTFTYSTSSSGTVDAAEIPEDRGAFATTSFVTMSGDVALNSSADGEATVSGSLPFSTATGLATVSTEIQRMATTGVVVVPEEIRFTPGVQGGSVSVPADILEIDTKDREVAFNGEIAGARSKVDVLADFIYLAPGENVIEFEDNGKLESKATATIYYRSGWLS